LCQAPSADRAGGSPKLLTSFGWGGILIMQDQDGYSGYYTELPADSGLPRLRRCGNDCSRSALPTWQKPFQSGYINPVTPDEQRAWFLWLNAHQLLFIYWVVIAHACRVVTEALRSRDYVEAQKWLVRVAVLLHGSTAAMLNSGDFDSCYYLD